MDFAVWLSGIGRQSCEECRETYARASRPTPWDRTPPKRIDPPCGTCRPELLPESEPLAGALVKVQRQWVLDGRGFPVGLRVEGVEAALRRLGAAEDELDELTERVMELGDVMVHCFRRKIELAQG